MVLLHVANMTEVIAMPIYSIINGLRVKNEVLVTAASWEVFHEYVHPIKIIYVCLGVCDHSEKGVADICLFA